VAWKSVVWLGDKKAKKVDVDPYVICWTGFGRAGVFGQAGLVVRYDGIEVRVWG
jgi:hypothetical protein